MASASDQMDLDGGEDRTQRAASVLSMDDIEAAQALEGLRSDTSQSSPPQNESTSPSSEPPAAEPLLSLLTSSHPLLSSAINGSVSMYTSSKSYSPRFRTGAEFLERNIGSRVANTVGTVGRKTGVEGGLRWALQRREAAVAAARGGGADPGEQAQESERIEERGDTMDIEKGASEDQQLGSSSRRLSSTLSTAETLPPYDSQSSPNYEELVALDSRLEPIDRSQRPTTWKGRLAVSTSGLGVAMSEESLRSLAYCLTWLRWANTRLGNVMIVLKRILQERETSGSSGLGPEQRPRSPTAMAQQIQQLKGEVLQTLKQVVDILSKHAGSALPENARNLVRRHLTSLPRRFRIASTSNPPADSTAAQGDTATNAHRALVLAEEGLDMMAQVSIIVNNTLVSAEGWCDQLRRPKPSIRRGTEEDRDSMPPPLAVPLDDKPAVAASPSQQDDVEMTGMQEKS